MKSNNDHFLRNKIAELSELPKDVVMGMPVLTILGQNELCLENYRFFSTHSDKNRADSHLWKKSTCHLLYERRDEGKRTDFVR